MQAFTEQLLVGRHRSVVQSTSGHSLVPLSTHYRSFERLCSETKAESRKADKIYMTYAQCDCSILQPGNHISEPPKTKVFGAGKCPNMTSFGVGKCVSTTSGSNISEAIMWEDVN